MKNLTRTMLVALLTLSAVTPALAQSGIAVIDVQRVVTESDPGKEALGKLKKLQDHKLEEGRAKQAELDSLREQFSKQRFTLTDEKLADLSKQIESLGIDMQRFQDDAQRELDDSRRVQLGGLEQAIMPVIDEVGREKGLTLIFNKFQSGLVFADDRIDITDEVIRRFNTSQ